MEDQSMADDEFLSDDDYVPVPLKEVARHELHPMGTAARIAELEAALLDLYSGTAEYVYLNHLGDPHNTTPMRNAAKVLGAPALEAYDRLARLTAPGSPYYKPKPVGEPK
jgi:hypothetical protein